MSRRFALVTVLLVAAGSFLVGLIVAGSLTPAPAVSRTSRPSSSLTASARLVGGVPALVNFADVAERINPAVVNIDATSRGGAPDGEDGDEGAPPRDGYVHPWENPNKGGDLDVPRRGTGSGVIIEPEGFILTNHHVIERAERILVKLADGRTLRAEVVGSEYLGHSQIVTVTTAVGSTLRAKVGPETTAKRGEHVGLAFDASAVSLFDKASGRALALDRGSVRG